MKMHKNTTIAAVAGLALLFTAGAVVGADRDQRGQLPERDYKFVKEAASGGISEVEIGELAKQKGVSQAVRDFGDRMATDHKKANDELKEIASKKGAVIPAQLSRSENSTMNRLQKLNGAEFDKAYASAMVKDHKADVKAFKDAADDVKDPDVKAFAQKMIPKLEEHLRMAQEMEASVKQSKL
jgi:putative membrane protein